MNLNIKKSFTLNNKIYYYYSLKEFEKKTNFKIQNLPFSIRILLENLYVIKMKIVIILIKLKI